MLEALRNCLEQSHFAFVESLVVGPRDAYDSAVDLPGEGRENEPADADPERITRMHLRLRELERVHAAFVVEQLRALIRR